jgi:hypothetical protein
LYINSSNEEEDINFKFQEQFNSYNILSKIKEFNNSLEERMNDDTFICKFDFPYETYKKMKDKRAISDLYLNLDSEELSVSEPIDDNYVFFKIGYNFLVKFKKKTKNASIELYEDKNGKDKYNIKFYLRNKYYELNQYFTFINK